MTPLTEVSDAPSGQTPGFHDRMLLRSASSREPDAAVAVRELARQLGDEADLYLAFVPAGYDLDAMAAALTGWAGDRLIACTSAGAIGSQGYTRADLLAVAVSGPPVAAQQDVIMTLVAASERRAESAARLGTQHVVEQRTARLHQAERVLRSVIEALDGALCIVGADSTVLDANRRWLQLLPPAEPAAGGPVAGAVGSDFFAWCRTTDGMQDLLAEAADLVREVLETCDPTDATDPAEPADRSVKGQVELDGALRWVVVRIHPVRDHPAARAVVSMIDITDGLRTQEQLRLATADAEAVGRRRDLIAGPCLESAEFSSFLDRLDRGQGADGEFQLLSRQGELYWADIEVRPVQDGDHVAHLVWVEQDVTVRRQTQERLQEAMNHTEQLVGALSWEKTLLAGVISAVPQLVFWKDSHGRYVGCNEAYLAFRGIGGQSEVLGRSDSDIGLDDPLNMIVNAAQAIAEQRDRGERAGLGSITISTARTQAEFVITITDDGPGMTEKVRTSPTPPSPPRDHAFLPRDHVIPIDHVIPTARERFRSSGVRVRRWRSTRSCWCWCWSPPWSTPPGTG